jgi:hypothetical protein
MGAVASSLGTCLSRGNDDSFLDVTDVELGRSLSETQYSVCTLVGWRDDARSPSYGPGPFVVNVAAISWNQQWDG